MPAGWMLEDPLSKMSVEEIDALVNDDPDRYEAMWREYLTARSSAPVVGELDGQQVRLPGFVVPLEFEGYEVSEFLLVPYIGACIHVPPPPANQIVYVTSDDAYPIEGLFEPVWVTGEISTNGFVNELGDAGYTIEASRIEPYRPIIITQ